MSGSGPDARPGSRLARFARAEAIVVLVVAAAAWVGWTADVDLLMRRTRRA